jgi:hypothetical protein
VAGTVLVKEVVRQWSVLLQDIDPQFARNTEVEGIGWLNVAQRAIFKFLPVACSRVDTIRLEAGTLQSIENIPAASVKLQDGTTPGSPVVGSMLLDVLHNMGADGSTPGRAIRLIADGRESLDTISPNWHAETAGAIIGFVYDPRYPRQFLAYPGVPAGRLWARIAYVAMPLPITGAGTPGVPVYHAAGANATVISVHDEHVDDLVNYMAARALMKNAQHARATGMSPETFVSLFTASINAKSNVLMNYNPNLKHLPFAPSPIGAAS